MRAEQVLEQVRTVRTQLPRLGTRKLLHKIAPRLRAQGVACGRDALFTLLRQRGWLVPKKRSYLKTTDSHHRFPCHPNLVKNTPKPSAPNQRWVSDLTYLPTRQGTVYLSLVTDAFSRRIVGHHVHASRHTAGCLAALERAERVNGILKDEFLFMLPDELAQARLLVGQAVHLYNEERPHLALNYLTPNQVHQQGKSPTGKSEQGPCLIPVNK